MSKQVRLKGPWVWDYRYFRAGDVVTLTDDQYEWFTAEFPNGYEDVEPKKEKKTEKSDG